MIPSLLEYQTPIKFGSPAHSQYCRGLMPTREIMHAISKSDSFRQRERDHLYVGLDWEISSIAEGACLRQPATSSPITSPVTSPITTPIRSHKAAASIAGTPRANCDEHHCEARGCDPALGWGTPHLLRAVSGLITCMHASRARACACTTRVHVHDCVPTPDARVCGLTSLVTALVTALACAGMAPEPHRWHRRPHIYLHTYLHTYPSRLSPLSRPSPIAHRPSPIAHRAHRPSPIAQTLSLDPCRSDEQFVETRWSVPMTGAFMPRKSSGHTKDLLIASPYVDGDDRIPTDH